MGLLDALPISYMPNLVALTLLPVAIIVSVFVYYVALGVYNIWFHPLRHYPGPVQNAATRLTWSFQVISGRSQFLLSQLHEKYGDVVRIGPNELSYTSSKAWKDIYQSRSGKSQFQKDPLHYQKHDKIPSLHVSSDADHTRMRRLISHAFSDKALRDQEPIMKQYSDLLVKRLHEATESGDPVNIKQWYQWTLFDLFGDLCFNQPFGCLESGKSHPWIDIIGESIQAFYYLGLARRLPGLQSLVMKAIPKKKTEQAAWHSEFSKNLADRRMAMETDRPDFMSFILKHNETEKALTVPEIRSNTNVLIPGGSETTSTFLTGTTWNLLRHPSKYKRLVEEIRSTFKDAHEINISTTAGMEYLNAVINEGLRVYPPVPSNMPRVVPEEGAVVCEKWLPGGISVCVAPYPMTHTSRNFKDPDSFVPERWLKDPLYKTDDLAASQPFSFGPRNCIGKNLAYAEMRLVLCKILWHFDLELMSESEKWFPHNMIVIWDGPPLYVKLHAVDR
ncbi:uncharacterized protein A1O5_09978 [Cladophialophora psammophila CBS 110553]|uniref:Cytochrome P450 oxidoreductase n=1 Tax=Cladophialophora psammophila CBS 110553 TaxID=1182543 RepID=W9WFQ7_9EURO|nr:uncharacterized protein A1O5_09978 [Cladophialophora psammophila CBS 110553]EXJ66783.1 hypothetical protein A1O5_09978 [Cladophialophora psammophila CBS 110553]